MRREGYFRACITGQRLRLRLRSMPGVCTAATRDTRPQFRPLMRPPLLQPRLSAGVPRGSASLGHTFLSQAEDEHPTGKDRSGAPVSVKGSWEGGKMAFSVPTGDGRLLRSGRHPKCGKKVQMLGDQEERQRSTAEQCGVCFGILRQGSIRPYTESSRSSK